MVTAIAGRAELAASAPLQMPDAVLARHNGKTYVIWDGHRSEIDLTNKAVALALGLDSGAPAPVAMSKALFDAIPATDPLVLPGDPQRRAPSPLNLGPGVVIGSVLAVHDLTQPGHRDVLCPAADGVCSTFRRSWPRCCARRTASARPPRWRCPRTRWPRSPR